MKELHVRLRKKLYNIKIFSINI